MKVSRYKDKYLVSENGDISRIYKTKIKKKKLQNSLRGGYLQTSINGKAELVHRIVMATFKGESELTVDHINGNTQDNRLCNLQYLTRSQNSIKRNEKAIEWNGKKYKSAEALSKELGLHKTAVSQSIYKKRKIKGYYAKYTNN